MANTPKLTKAKAKARAGISAAYKQGLTLEKIADQFLTTSSKLAATTSEVLGGVLGGATFTSISLAIPPTVFALSTTAVSCIGVVGLAVGIFIARGTVGLLGDRTRREVYQNVKAYGEIVAMYVKTGMTIEEARERAKEDMRIRKPLSLPTPNGGAKLLNTADKADPSEDEGRRMINI